MKITAQLWQCRDGKAIAVIETQADLRARVSAT